MIRIAVATPEQMRTLGSRVARLLRAGDIVALNGELGAGKTTFTRGVGDALGVRGAVTSPTFVLARTHPTAEGLPLVHVDAYRLGSAAELDDLDIDFPASITVVEWAAGMVDGLAESLLTIDIARPTGAAASDRPTDEEPVEPRTVTITATGPRWAGVDLEPLAGPTPTAG